MNCSECELPIKDDDKMLMAYTNPPTGQHATCAGQSVDATKDHAVRLELAQYLLSSKDDGRSYFEVEQEFWRLRTGKLLESDLKAPIRKPPTDTDASCPCQTWVYSRDPLVPPLASHHPYCDGHGNDTSNIHSYSGYADGDFVIVRKPLAQRILRLDDDDRVSSCGPNAEFICTAKELKEIVR